MLSCHLGWQAFAHGLASESGAASSELGCKHANDKIINNCLPLEADPLDNYPNKSPAYAHNLLQQ